MGASITERPDGFVITGPQQLSAAMVDSQSDHRLAMSLAIAAMLADGESRVQHSETIQESFPGFADVLRLLGAEVY